MIKVPWTHLSDAAIDYDDLEIRFTRDGWPIGYDLDPTIEYTPWRDDPTEVFRFTLHTQIVVAVYREVWGGHSVDFFTYDGGDMQYVDGVAFGSDFDGTDLPDLLNEAADEIDLWRRVRD